MNNGGHLRLESPPLLYGYKMLICRQLSSEPGSHLEIDRIVIVIFRHSVVGEIVVELENKILGEAIIGRKPIVGH